MQRFFVCSFEILWMLIDVCKSVNVFNAQIFYELGHISHATPPYNNKNQQQQPLESLCVYKHILKAFGEKLSAVWPFARGKQLTYGVRAYTHWGRERKKNSTLSSAQFNSQQNSNNSSNVSYHISQCTVHTDTCSIYIDEALRVNHFSQSLRLFDWVMQKTQNIHYYWKHFL